MFYMAPDAYSKFFSPSLAGLGQFESNEQLRA